MKNGDYPECCHRGEEAIRWMDDHVSNGGDLPAWVLPVVGNMLYYAIYYCPWCAEKLPKQTEQARDEQKRRMHERRQRRH